jgi:hypothetical protein
LAGNAAIVEMLVKHAAMVQETIHRPAWRPRDEAAMP